MATVAVPVLTTLPTDSNLIMKARPQNSDLGSTGPASKAVDDSIQLPSAPPYFPVSEAAAQDEKYAHLRLDEKADLLTDPATHPQEEKLLSGLTAFLETQDPIPGNLPKLLKPIAIPRLHPGTTYPFARAWAPELDSHAIRQADWLAFLDNINTISFPHPIITVLELAAVGVGFVPLDEANGIAAGLDIVAILLAMAIVKARCRRFLMRANDRYFHARGLHARILCTRDMRRALGIPKDEHLIVPLTEEVVGMTSLERILAKMKLYSCELSLDVPEQTALTMQAKVFKKAATWRVRHKVKKADWGAKRNRKGHWKRHMRGKKIPKIEGLDERIRAKFLSWVVVQSLEEFEQQEREIAEEKERKIAERRWPRLPFRGKKPQVAETRKDESIETT